MQNAETMPKVDSGAKERYELFQHHIEHETDTHNQKLIFNAITQSFLFSAYCSLMNAPKEPRSAIFAGQLDLLVWVLPITALVVALATYASILSSLIYIGRLQRAYKVKFAGHAPDDLPPVNGDRGLRFLSFLASYILPAGLIVAWLVILGEQVRHELSPPPASSVGEAAGR